MAMDSINKPYGWVKNGEYVLYIDKPDSVFNYTPLYTHPVIKLNEVNRAIGFDNGYKAGYNKGHEDGRKLVTVKELTDEEIADLIANKVTDSEMIKQALRKAQEKWKIVFSSE